MLWFWRSLSNVTGTSSTHRQSLVLMRMYTIEATRIKSRSSVTFYAVRHGRVPGIYTTWATCREQIHKFKSAEFKAFPTEEQALVFLKGTAIAYKEHQPFCQSSVTDKGISSIRDLPISSFTEERAIDHGKTGGKSPITLTFDSTLRGERAGEPLVVYTDGCALGNGREGARAGIGVWFGPNDPRNVSKALEGKATNNRAEIMAVVELLEQTQDDVQDMKIYTDSTYVRNAMTKWISQWRINGWIDSKGMPVKNQDLLRRLDTLLTAAKERKKVTLLHIPGHRGYRGNEEADRLANLGAAASRPSG